ncbi:hypothetical protein B0J11DRAFT_525946 [Dendryphion nanum]|uniref:Uncharacterized protein n=1 Tax=Dendryphion nanum TaxID=256645 RepID=A0A9P9DWW9_9PLEO|nr:hypothetical protein B0J11DRAFT_525946 [Dendryphion nanum]
MEPRIATLLGESAVLDPISPLPSAPTRRHLLADSTFGGDDGLTAPSWRHDATAESVLTVPIPPTRPSPHRLKSSVPIAEVLNDEAPAHPIPQAHPNLSIAASSPHTQPFSGRLQDILLDSSQQGPNKRRKVDSNARRTSPSAVPAAENALLTLPKPPELPKKTVRRPRIPPLLQGLHQPPPLPPQARLFPPITSESGAFGRNLGEMGALRSPLGWESNKEKEVDIAGGKENTKIAVVTKIYGIDMEKPRKGNKLAPITCKDKEIMTEGTLGNAGSTTQRKGTRKRNKWSEGETKDLLQGVSKYGIGNWKKILNDSEYSFNERTAVDLKDRFRTCCPSEASKLRGILLATGETSEPPSHNYRMPIAADKAGSTDQGPKSAISTPANGKPQRKVRSDVHKKSSTELAEMGIIFPFQPSKRRQRREFTDFDDNNLWKGYEKYGPIWHSMRDDKELNFISRHPTDLRDRFRIRYPEEYAKAGYKLKLKDEQIAKEKEPVADKDEPSSQDSSALSSGSQQSNTLEKMDKLPAPPDQLTVAPSSAPASSDLRAHTLQQPLRSSFPTPLQEFSDLMSEDDGDGGRSPVTLNRNIFQWADANPLQSNITATSSSTNTMLSISSLASGDTAFNLFAGIDDMHIDPRALRMPLAPMQNGNYISALPTYLSPNQVGQFSSTASNMLPNATNTPLVNPASHFLGANTSTSVPRQSSNTHLLRTPNLPTIVFPHVPVASARNAMHNLPPPSDLLSGLDFESMRPEQQQQHATGFALDDSLNFGFALPSTAMSVGYTSNTGVRVGISSNSNNGVGRVSLMASKDRERVLVMDAGGEFGERSLLNSAV